MKPIFDFYAGVSGLELQLTCSTGGGWRKDVIDCPVSHCSDWPLRRLCSIFWPHDPMADGVPDDFTISRSTQASSMSDQFGGGILCQKQRPVSRGLDLEQRPWRMAWCARRQLS